MVVLSLSRQLICLLALLLCLPAEVPAATFKMSGYYKNLFATSKTTDTEEDFFADTQRLRLQGDAQLTGRLSSLVIYDHELLLNDFANTADFSTIRQKNQKNLAFWDADKVLTDRNHLYQKHSVYRAYLKYAGSFLHCTAGKQAIDWSRTRLYHPLDIFNPVSPLDIEQDEKAGVDAVNLEYFPEHFTSLNLIYVPYKNSEKSGYGLRILKKLMGYDLMLMAVEYKKDSIFGFSFDGNIKNAGLRGEATAIRKDNKKEFTRAVIEMDYNLAPKLYAIAEYFYNGGAEKDSAQFLGSYEFSRQALSIRKHISGFGFEYELSGIIKLANYAFYDFEGKSVFLNPELRYNIFTNADITLGAQAFWGNADSEFGNYQHTYYAQLKYFF